VVSWQIRSAMTNPGTCTLKGIMERVMMAGADITIVIHAMRPCRAESVRACAGLCRLSDDPLPDLLVG
jgi:hypothetical protein